MTEGRTRSRMRRAVVEAVAADGTGCEIASASSVGRRLWAAPQIRPSRSSAIPGATPRPGGPARFIAVGARLLDQAVELAGVLARDLADHVGRQVAELLLDVLRRLGPHTVGGRGVRRPPERRVAHLVDDLGPDAVELERRLALAPPVVAGLHRQAEVAEAVLPLEVHAIEPVGNPADAALAERDLQVRIPLERGRADDRGQDVDQVHLKSTNALEQRGPAGEGGGRLLADAGRRAGGRGGGEPP